MTVVTTPASLSLFCTTLPLILFWVMTGLQPANLVESDSDSNSDTWDVDAENDRGAVTKAESESYVVSRNTISVR